MDAILHCISSLLIGLLFDSLTRFLYPLGSLGKASPKLYMNDTCLCYLVSGNPQMKIRTEVTEVIPLDVRSPKVKIRDLTIRQRRRPWKRRWKIDFASLHFFSRSFQETQLVKRRELGLELKRRDRTRVLTEMVQFIALPSPFPSKLKIWSFHVVIMQGLQRNVQKSKYDARAELLFCSLNLLLFWRSRYRRCRSFVRSLIC